MFLKQANKFLVYFFSLLPLSIIIGPAVSLINIVLLDLFVLFLLFYNKYLNIFSNQTVKVLFFLYFYLLINSFTAIDSELGFSRSLGFIRYILLFVAINYVFYLNKNKNNLLFFWNIVILIFCVDVFIEFFSGSNILGFNSGIYKDRIVSFFRNEPVSGSFLYGFYLIIFGFCIHDFDNKNNFNKIISILIIIIVFGGIFATGERANFIRAFLSTLFLVIFFTKFEIKKKISFLIIFLCIIAFSITQSSTLKQRYFNLLIKPIVNYDSGFLSTQNIHLKIYEDSLHVFKNNLILGVGNKNYRKATCEKQPNISRIYNCTTHPHQVLFELLSEHGIVGTIIILSIIFFLIFKILRIIIISKNFLQISCFIYVLLAFLPIIPSGAFFSDFNSNFFWINFALMYASNNKTNIFSKI